MVNVEMLTVEAAATRGRVSGNTIRRLIQRGMLPAMRFNDRSLRIPASALERFITMRLAEEKATRAARSAARKRAS
jgi:excisionase family DNA binding protein